MKGRLAPLDSLRGWAAAYVIVYHVALMPKPALHTPGWAAPVVLTGGTGVTLFFVASAFSLCLAARPGEDRGFSLAAYALRRFFRIAPLFYVALAASLLRDRWLFSASHSVGAIAASATFVFNFWPGWETGIVWASWTIGVEMPFYCLFPFVEARTRNVIAAATLVLALLLAAAMWPQAALLHRAGFPQPVIDSQIQFGLIRNLPIFGFGILAYRLYERFVVRRPLPASLGIALLLGAGCLYAALLRGALGPAPFTDSYYWQAVIYSAVVLGLAIHPSRLVINRLTLHMGKVSYSLYLLHPFVVFAMFPVYRVIEAKGWPSTLGFGLCIALTLGTTLALASVTYVAIEAPGMRLGKWVTMRLGESLMRWRDQPPATPI